MMISVLMTTFNGEKYVAYQMESILRQTRKPDEVIIVDDNSTDQTVLIIKKFIAENKLDNWRIVVNPTNKGWRKNFHDSILLTSGDIIFFSDQDDVWFKEKVEMQAGLIEKDRRVNIIGSSQIYFTNKPQSEPRILESQYREISLKDKKNRLIIGCGGSTMAFRKSFYNDVKYYYKETMAHDDFLWKVGVIHGGLYMLSCSTIHRRLHGNNASTKKRTYESSKIIIGKLIEIAESVYDYLEEKNGELSDYQIKKKSIKRFIDGNKKRLEMISRKKPIYCLRILPYYPWIYNSMKTFLGDVMLTAFPKIR